MRRTKARRAVRQPVPATASGRQVRLAVPNGINYSRKKTLLLGEPPATNIITIITTTTITTTITIIISRLLLLLLLLLSQAEVAANQILPESIEPNHRGIDRSLQWQLGQQRQNQHRSSERFQSLGQQLQLRVQSAEFRTLIARLPVCWLANIS